MSPLKKVSQTYSTYQGMYGAASPHPVRMVEKITSDRDVVKPVPIKLAGKSDFHTRVDLLTKAFTSEMAQEAMNAKADKLKYCGAVSSQHVFDDNVPEKLLDRRKKYNSMRNELSKRSQLVSSYLSKYTNQKQNKEKEQKERNVSAAGGLRRTKKYDHIQSKVDTNLRRYTSLTSLDNLKAHEQTRTQSAITTSKRTCSVENLSTLNNRRVRSARNADDYKYLKPISKSSSQQFISEVQNEPTRKSLFSNPLEVFKRLPLPTAEKLNFYSAQFCRERLKKDKHEDDKLLRSQPLSRTLEDNKGGVLYGSNSSLSNASTPNLDLMSTELACIKSSYESMADKLRKTTNPVLTRPPHNPESIRSPRPSPHSSISITRNLSSPFDATPSYSRSSNLHKTSSGVRLASNTYYDRNRSDVTGSLTEEYLKDVNNSINSYLGSRSSSHGISNRVNYKPIERYESGGSSKLYRTMSMDTRMDEPSGYNNSNNRLKKATSMDFKAVKSNSSEYNQLKETLCEASRRLGVSLPCVTSRNDSQETTSTTTTTITSPASKEETLRIHSWIDSISSTTKNEETKDKGLKEYNRPLSGVWSQHSNDSEDNRPTSALLKSKWLSKSMPTDLDDDKVKSILKKKKKVRINLEFNKTYLL